MRIVLDTNVLVSALLKPGSAPARLVEEFLLDTAGQTLSVLVDARILDEYREVLAREKFGFEPALVDDLLAAIEAVAIFIEDPLPVGAAGTPADDRPFLEVAVAGEAKVIVTGNKRHFPETGSIEVRSPVELLRLLEDAD